MTTERVQYELSLRDLLTGKLRDANSAANRLEGTIANVGKAIGIAFAAKQIMDFGRKVIDAGTTVENARTGLTTLLKDSDAAAMVIKNTMKDATTTPFAFEGLLAANKALISAGVGADRAREDVLNLANAIAATGGGDDEMQRMVVNLQQIRNTGKATALDIKQFAYAGVNVYKALADATGKPIEKVKDMEVSYDLLTMALKKAHDAGGIYANGLENMANNTSVKISNMGDNLFQFFVKIFDTIKPILDPIVDGINDAIGWISEKFDGISGSITAAGETMRNGFSQLVEFLRPLFESIWGAMQKMWGAIVAMWDALKPLHPLFAAIGVVVRDVFGWLFDVFGGLFSMFGGFVDILVTIGVAIYRIAEKLGIVRVLKNIFEGIKWVIDKIADGLSWVYDNVIKPVVDGIKWAYNAVKDMLGLGTPEDVAITVTKKTETVAAPESLTPKGALPKLTGEGAGAKSQTKGAQGSKSVNITVHINSLIKDFKISTTNLHESANVIREKITEALIGATNDSQHLAGTN